MTGVYLENMTLVFLQIKCIYFGMCKAYVFQNSL